MFVLIDAMTRSEKPRGVSELARELSFTKTNVHRLLRTLEKNGFARRTSELGRYEMTLKLWELGSRIVTRIEVKKESAGFLSRLANLTRETVLLSIPAGMEVIYVDKIESNEPVRAHTKIGARAPIYCVATGKAMLAYMPPAQIQDLDGLLEPHTESTITNIEALIEELAQIRRQGYAEYRAEWREGVNGIAAPIFDMNGSVVAAVGISGPATRLTPDRFRQLSPLIVDTAAAISRQLGYNLTSAIPTQSGELTESLST